MMALKIKEEYKIAKVELTNQFNSKINLIKSESYSNY